MAEPVERLPRRDQALANLVDGDVQRRPRRALGGARLSTDSSPSSTVSSNSWTSPNSASRRGRPPRAPPADPGRRRRARRARRGVTTGDDVLALGVEYEVHVHPPVPERGIAGESDPDPEILRRTRRPPLEDDRGPERLRDPRGCAGTRPALGASHEASTARGGAADLIEPDPAGTTRPARSSNSSRWPPARRGARSTRAGAPLSTPRCAPAIDGLVERPRAPRPWTTAA